MSAHSERLKDEGSRTQVVIAGATAGLIARFVVAPLDVVKIRLQLQTDSPSTRFAVAPTSVTAPATSPAATTSTLAKPLSAILPSRGTLATISHIVRHEGVTALWKGNVPAELMYVTYSALQFTTYRFTTQCLRQLHGDAAQPVLSHAAESFIAGAAAGAVATTATYPLDLLRTRFAAQGNERVYASLRASVRDILVSEGPGGFFRGVGASVAQIVPFMGIFFATYESLRLPAARLPLGSGDATAGIVASVIAKTGVFPLDLVRKRLQVQGPTRERYANRNMPVYTSATGAIKDILRTEGIRGLYRGLAVSLIKSAPTSTLTVWTYERVLRLLQQANIG